MSQAQPKVADRERLVRRQFKLTERNARSLRREAARLDQSLQWTVNAILDDYFRRPAASRLTA